MHNPLTPTLVIHASSGAIMLLSGVGAMISKKGQKYHRSYGKIYAISTALVAVSGFIIAFQTSNQFLMGTSIFVSYMMVTAYRSLYLKQLYKDVKAMPLDWVIMVGAVIATAYLLILGGVGLFNGNGGSVVPLVFGLICMSFNIRDIKKYTRGPADKKHWLYNHIIGMSGSYIAGITAFLAVNAGYFSTDFMLSVWLAPTLVGTPLIIMTVRKYSRKSDAQLPLANK